MRLLPRPVQRTAPTQMEAAMKIRIEDCCFFACGLIFLCLFGADTAVAQRESTLNRDSEPEAPMTVPADAAPHLEIARGASDRWAPPDIDEVQFPVAEAASCPLSDIVSKAGTRVEELIRNLDRFAATEVIQHQSVNHSGNLHRPESRKFNYVFSMKEAPDGYMNVEEYRNRGTSPEEFPEHIATLGMPSLVLVFHPKYEKNFRMSCEGLGKWQGQLQRYVFDCNTWQSSTFPCRFQRVASRSGYHRAPNFMWIFAAIDSIGATLI